MDKKIKYDLIIFGATGFTGRLVVEYLINNYGAKSTKFSWAIAGRNKLKLSQLKHSLSKIDPLSKDIAIFIADSFDLESLNTLTSSCRVIISTVGPYLKCGLPLIESCVKNRTHYCDLTGEVPFIRESIDLYHKEAKKNKCKIIHSCGFDSIPSDIGVLFLQKKSLKKYNKVCAKVNLYVEGIKGGLSGGTIASMVNIMDYLRLNPKKKSILKNPFSLNPVGEMKNYSYSPALKSIRWDNSIQKWTCPFLMSGINTRIVRRTNAIAKLSYGENFNYNEMSSYNRGLKGFLNALMMLITLGILQLSLKTKLLFTVLKKIVLPMPGEGPSNDSMKNGFFKMKIIGHIDELKISSVFIEGDSDPGYSATAKMLTESALSILLNKDKIPNLFGVLTPASALDLVLIDRLKNKGISFK